MKTFSITIVLVIATYFIFAQQANISLHTVHDGNNTYHYEARDNISLHPDFSYSPAGTNEFTARIDEDLILPIDYNTYPVDVDSRALNYNLPVGTTAGSHSVSMSGATNYQVPIIAPPGTAGMVPSISMVYNSQAGNGLLGYGWNLAGLSAITRMGHTIYHDDNIKGVNFVDDRFAMDGNRLIFASGSNGYGGDNSKYYTEVFNASRITSEGTAGGGPESFTVELKGGNTIEYGVTQNSRFYAHGKNDVLVWKINRITDKMGNYIEFEYQTIGGTQHLIKEIRYTGNESQNLSPYNKIHFYYSEREDKQVLYVKGSSVKSEVLLDHIKVMAGNSLVRNYVLKYHLDFYSHLIEVKEYNGRGERYNSTVFEWENNDSQYAYGSQFNQVPYNYFTGDFNGDGKSDILAAKYAYDEYWVKYYMDYKIYNGGALNDIVDQGDFSICRNIVVGDYNGDGLSDIIITHKNESSGTDTWTYRKWITEPSGFSFDKSTYHFPITSGIPEHEYPFKSVQVGDLNGDSQQDIIFSLRDEYYTAWVLHIMTNTFENTVSKSSINNNINKIKLADFNGNGKDELIYIMEEYTNSCQMYELDANNDWVSVFTDGYPTKDHRIFTGDFNGDGKSDIMTWCETAGWELKYFSENDDYFVSMQVDWPGDKNIDPNANVSDNNYHVADFNSDGKADILESYTNSSGVSTSTSTINIFFFNGSSFETKSIDDINLTSLTFLKENLGDFNGDGNLDMITGSYGNPYRKTIFFNQANPMHCITKIANGFNNKTIFEYEPLTNSTVYTKYNDAFTNSNKKLYDIQAPFYVVNEVKMDNGIGEESTISYHYEGARVHRYGKGFLGFQKKTVSKEIGLFDTYKKYSLVENHFDNPAPYYNLSLLNTKNILKSILFTPGTPPPPTYETLSEQTSTTNYKTGYESNNKVFMPYTEQVVATNFQKDITITTNTEVDIYGNVLINIIDYDGEGTTGMQIDYTSTGSWCDYIPYHSLIAQNRGTQAQAYKQVSYDYYPNGFLKNVITYVGHPKHTTKHLEYDNFGNMTSSTLSSSGLDPRTVSLSYDNKGRFVLEKTNALDHSTSYIYDHKTGNIRRSTSIDQHTTIYNYDGFGKLKKVTYPDGNKSHNELEWDANNSYGNILFYSKSQADGSPEARTYFDTYGRTRLKTMEDINGNFVASETVYNANGQVLKTSEPFFYGNSPTKWTSYEYQADGKTSAIYHPNQEATTYSYNGKESSTTYSGTNITNTNTIDAFGKTILATDPGGTLAYTYYSSGLTKTITSPKNDNNLQDVIFEMHYDVYGRQDYLIDPDAGRIDYEHNAYGELIWQKDEEDNESFMTYDILGRMETKTDSEGAVILYDYVISGNGIGSISSIDYSNGISYAYTYDNFGRILKKEENIEGTIYENSFTYDDLGRVKTFSYPSGFTIENSYDNKGYLTTIYRGDDNSMLYGSPQYNVRGQLTDYDIGNGLHTQKGFDEYGFQASITTGSIQDLEYEFDAATANLNWRQDNNFGLNETFGYDNTFKNRLTDWNVGTQLKSATFMSNGNIKTKSDFGTYHYEYDIIGGGGGPHSVTKISDPVTVPLETNQFIDYNVFNKVVHIEHQTQGYDYNITYGPDQARKKTEYEENGTLLKTKYYIGAYEKEVDEMGNTREMHYIPGGDGLLAIYVIDNGVGTMYYVQKDHLASIYSLTDENGNIAIHNGQQQIYNFDPWGRRRNPTDWTFTNVPDPNNHLTDRGYTGHQHLDDFDLINMNGRMYDPLLGRMLSPDNFVQAPNNSQSFNRYSYALNNPLIYTDPSGEFVGMAFMFVAFTGEFASNIIQGESDPAQKAYSSATNTMTQMSNAFQYPVYSNDNTTVTAGISPFALGVSVNATHRSGNMTYSASGGYGFTGWYGGVGATYTNNDWAFGVSGGVGNNNWGVGVSGKYKGYGLGYTFSHYGDAIGPDGISNSQNVGGVKVYLKDFTIRLENDFLVFDDEDRWRSNAVEIGYKEFLIGTSLYNNYRKDGDPFIKDEYSHNNGKNGRWVNGQTYASPLYIGFRHGNTVDRVGYSHPIFQHIAQNKMVHERGFLRIMPFGKANYYMDYPNFNQGIFLNSNWDNPHSIYGR